MDNEAMMNRAKQLVVDYFNSHVDATDGGAAWKAS